MAVHIPPHYSRDTKKRAVEASKALRDELVGHHTGVEGIRAELAEVRRQYDYLALGKDKLILRAVSDRIEEVIICGVLNIDRDEMRVRRLFNLEKLAAYVGREVATEDGRRRTVTQQDVDDVRADLAKHCDRAAGRGRAAVKTLGDMEAHEEPDRYLGAASNIIKHVFPRDVDKINATKAMVRAYVRVLRTYHPDVDVECDVE